jgi:hypothetical protein
MTLEWICDGCVTKTFVFLLSSINTDAFAQCWLRHMKLDPETGLDPPGIRLRAAFGLEAADYLIPGFWIWARLIEVRDEEEEECSRAACRGHKIIPFSHLE